MTITNSISRINVIQFNANQTHNMYKWHLNFLKKTKQNKGKEKIKQFYLIVLNDALLNNECRILKYNIII